MQSYCTVHYYILVDHQSRNLKKNVPATNAFLLIICVSNFLKFDSRYLKAAMKASGASASCANSKLADGLMMSAWAREALDMEKYPLPV